MLFGRTFLCEPKSLVRTLLWPPSFICELTNIFGPCSRFDLNTGCIMVRLYLPTRWLLVHKRVIRCTGKNQIDRHCSQSNELNGWLVIQTTACAKPLGMQHNDAKQRQNACIANKLTHAQCVYGSSCESNGNQHSAFCCICNRDRQATRRQG